MNTAKNIPVQKRKNKSKHGPQPSNSAKNVPGHKPRPFFISLWRPYRARQDEEALISFRPVLSHPISSALPPSSPLSILFLGAAGTAAHDLFPPPPSSSLLLLPLDRN